MESISSRTVPKTVLPDGYFFAKAATTNFFSNSQDIKKAKKGDLKDPVPWSHNLVQSNVEVFKKAMQRLNFPQCIKIMKAIEAGKSLKRICKERLLA